MLTSSWSSSSAASVSVEKATSELLNGPDWTINIAICDSINSNHWDGKDVIKSLKKRLQHKSSKVQLLALTLLETLVKNCGDYVHFQIVEKNILQEMIKITKKKTDMHVRDKILVLLDSWQEAFGGPGGKYPQYYWAYEELRRSGVVFPQRSPDSVPIFTPPVAQTSLRHTQAGYGMPSNSSSRFDEAMVAENGNLSLSSIDSMRTAWDLLTDMLRAVNPNDRSSVKDEVIVDLVNQCRSNQKKLMQMFATTGDEELLSQGLDLNDGLQNVLAKHDAIASGSPLPHEATSSGTPPAVEPAEVKHQASVSSPTPPPVAVNGSHQASVSKPTPPPVVVNGSQVEEEDEEDDFTLLARRHTKTRSTASEDTSTGTGESAASVNVPCNALALPDPPAPVRTSKEQDMVDLLSLALTTTTLSPQAPSTPPSSSSEHPATVSPTAQGVYSNGSQGYHGNQGQASFNGYVAPWAQPQLQSQAQTQSLPQFQSHQYYNPQQMQPQPPSQQYPHSASNFQSYPQTQQQYHQYQPYGYPPPPWAPTPGYLTNQNRSAPTRSHMSSVQQVSNAPPTFRATQEAKPLQQFNSFPVRANNGSSLNGEPIVNNSSPNAPNASKPFVPSYRLFEDLNVLGNGDARFKTSGSPSSSSGSSNPAMVGK